MLLQIRATDTAIAQILKAAAPYITERQVELFNETELAKPTSEDEMEFEATAQRIAELVQPTPRQPMRKKALRAALIGLDTFWDQEGEPDPSLRNALGALSKAMRPVFPYDASPIDRLATRRKRFNDDGVYLGTEYLPTALGIRVKELLQAQNSLG